MRQPLTSGERSTVFESQPCKNQHLCTDECMQLKQRLGACKRYVHNCLMKKVGYARVSTAGQALNAQLDQLGDFGCELTFSEKESGSNSDRPELQRALAALGEGDVLIVTRLDRLARSTRDLLEMVHRIEASGATLKSLAEAWADTTTPAGRLILTVLGGLAEFERTLIAERTAEGRARAKADGRRLGRKPTLSRYQRSEVVRMRANGISNAEIGRIMGVSRSTISRVRPEIS